MNKIISNHHISPEIIDLLKNSEKFVVLVSPYLYFWNYLKDEIIRCTERKVKVLLIIKEFDIDDKNPSVQLNKRMDILNETLEYFHDMNVEIYTNESLHTKLYMSEKLGLVSSMNLYDYSMKSNEELGVVVSDEESLEELNNYVKELKKKSSKIQFEDRIEVEEWNKQVIPNRFGTCIRCGKSDTKEPSPEIPVWMIYRHEDLEDNSNHHLCEDCLPIWKKYGSNVEYPEKYCFICGEEHETSVKKPFCKDCTYERKWSDDDFKNEVTKNIKEFIDESEKRE